jgi:hypothetical protein
MNRTEALTYTASIYIGGSFAEAQRICRRACEVGLCVTIEPVEFIYTRGQESGVRVGLINYPRFPAEPAEIFAKAEALARELIDGLYQSSASIVATDKTVWLSRRDTPATGGVQKDQPGEVK